MASSTPGQVMQKQHPVICQHSIWGSKQQRYRHCKLPAKLPLPLLAELQHLEQQCCSSPASSPSSPQKSEEEQQQQQQQHQARLAKYFALRTELLQPYLDEHKILCGHHQKEAQTAQTKQDEIEKQKREGTYQDPEEVKRLAKEQPVDPKDIPSEFLDAVEKVFSKDPSEWVRRVLDQADGSEDWKMGRSSGRRRRRRSGLGQDDYDDAADDDDDDGVEMEESAEIEFPCHESYEGLFSEAGAKKKRHLAQESQLIQSMSTLGLLRPVLEQDGGDDSKYQKAAERRRRRRRMPVFVEFGAGTGGLSRHLQLVLETIVAPRPATTSSSSPMASDSASGDQELTATTTPKTTTQEPFNFVLLDRETFRSRYQVDYMIRTQPRPVKPRVLRITKDVRELVLENLQLIHEVEPGVAWPDWTEGGGGLIQPKEETTRVPTHYICISKHFCGPATDLALSWMRDQQRRKKEEEEAQDLYSICFATCCHGICEPSLVVAKPYLLELLNSSTSSSSSSAAVKKRKRVESEGLDVKETDKQNETPSITTTTTTTATAEMISAEQLEAWIPWIIKLTGWATLGKEEESSLVARPGKDAAKSAAEEEVVMTRNQRRVLGKRCKKLLDMARCMYLMRECGFREAKSIEYTTESVESGAIVGTM
ncbi:hypothetical protein BGZ97_004150 [Linnemannia gamsii]|uniref:tRNA:m(4)X modification enzyme TRM13 n=1 Tax=Linnemannia gamsii TaxID=64522 RepID=A0A9P6QSH1_9FUNG|nr:hypothetical protein BGZ97_004150 [Linnemannia gamsii]